MKYKTLDEQIEIVISVLRENKELIDVLDYVSSLNLSNFYIAAGSVFQTVWNKIDNKDITVEKDLEYFELINNYCRDKGYKYKIDVSNEARMHIWQKEKFGIDIEPYKSSEDAIGKFIVTVHAIGVTKDKNEIKVYAPYGLSDIFSKTIRPIKHKYNTKDIYDKKANSWKERFDNLTVIEW